MATQAQIECVRKAFEAIAARDRAAARARVTDDFELVTSAFITGEREFHGADGIDQWFDRLEGVEASGEQVRLWPSRFYGDRAEDDLVLALTSVTISREAGEIHADSAYLCRLRGDRIASAQGFMEHRQGLEQLREPVELDG